jgi:hypothetical protein
MLKLASCSLAAMLYIAAVPQALAWEANPEPGYCAQFFPNRDCNTIGPEPAEPKQATPPKPVKAEKKKKHQSAAAPQHAKPRQAGGNPAVSR